MIENKNKCNWLDLKIEDVFAWYNNGTLEIMYKINSDTAMVLDTCDSKFHGGIICQSFLYWADSNSLYKLSKKNQMMWKHN